jgi:hypothetical protein
MAMKMDRRAFLKTSAAMAMAVSMTGLLGGCSDGAGSTDLGGFTASVTKWDVRQNPPALSEDQSKWTADVMVWVRTTNTKDSDWSIAGDAVMELKVDGVAVAMQGGGLLTNDGVLKFSRKHKVNEGWVNFKLNYKQKKLYDAIANKEAVVKFSIGTKKATDTYTALYNEGLPLKKDNALV